MARKEISTPLDLKNMDNHNYNYDELYGLIDETDRRISEDMWEEIKDANTMKMLKPVQTAADLPSEMPGKSLIPLIDKSLITVIDEQRVYGFVNGKWQPFNQIDLDPFEPFKDELAEIVAAYEKQIQNITTEVQNTKTSAIESIESTQSQSESQISTIRDEMTTQASDLTALFNDSMDKLTSKQDTALAEVDSAKQAAITALEDFNNTDTTEWQKYKLTESNGDRIPKSDTDVLSFESGFFEGTGLTGVPHDEASRWFIDVYQATGQDAKTIKATLGDTGDTYQRTVYGESDSGWKELTGVTRTVLFEGNSSGTGSLINLKDSLSGYASITISGSYPGGRFNETHLLYNDDGIVVNKVNLRDSDGGLPIVYEMVIEIKDDSTLGIKKEMLNNILGSDSGSTTETHYEINHIMGWS